MRNLITLLTDFGLSDPYPAAMKAVILRINPRAVIVDITHSIDKFNVRMGAFILAHLVEYFPEGSIHVGVVDPGVGTARRPLIVECDRGILVGPDNGLLIPAAKRLGLKRVYEILEDKVRIGRISHTFHGRDLFAPAAARLSIGERPEHLGELSRDYVDLKIPRPTLNGECIHGEVLYVDGFGNVVTNIDEEMLKKLSIGRGSQLLTETDSRKFKIKLVKAYGEVGPGTPLAIIDSFRMLELAVNMGNGGRFFGLKPGDKLVVRAV
ncbi:hypothetical protein CW710_01165 [Candidatus Bathyarchaeota archaeon]|nr:S-adenosyl-l-methionine hydroxide adenosyltransferase family protein [Candidatus Bathyarchaeota archaeon]RJS74631.1 MAG: hypothetical protein CW710_01165 [Candidatus Bathyarchaeota archaeon]